MPRANRHFIPGLIWHITHRCHKKEFLLRFRRDKLAWMYWALQAKIRYGLIILNFMITSNHIHLLGMAGRREAKSVSVGAGPCAGVGEDEIADAAAIGDTVGCTLGSALGSALGRARHGAITRASNRAIANPARETAIARALQLMQGRVAQEYNHRKGRHGAFWEDRYHATAIETGAQFVRCLTYIDMNMVRAGVVAHPREWPYCGYGELIRPHPDTSRGKLIDLVDTGALMTLLGARDLGELAAMRTKWIDEALRKGRVVREAIWTESVAVGSPAFLQKIQSRLGLKLVKLAASADQFAIAETSDEMIVDHARGLHVRVNDR
jgi:REP element-mobilizing transposase RayT